MTELFNVEDFNLFYGPAQALKDIKLTIESVSITALIGPSGCGKSTFLRSLNRMNDLIEGVRMTGSISFEGTEIVNTPIDVSDLRRRVGMVFQKPNPFPMSIYENVAYGPRTHGVKNKALLDELVEEALKGAFIFNEVKDRLNAPALGLSGGQQQRLCIARALAVHPEVLLMDEPTSALDPIATSHIEDLVAELKKHLAVVIVTHNMQQALRIADKTAFFLLGKLIEYDTTEVIFGHPARKETEDYVTGRFG